MAHYELTLTVLSPVHIGTGEELSPDEYIVAEQADGSGESIPMLSAIDMPRFLGGLTRGQRAAFDEAIAASSMTMIRKFLADNVEPQRHARWQAATCSELLNLYQRGLEDPSNQLAVHPMTRTRLDARSYIPGSSIKGAIRTAVIEQLIDESGQAGQLDRRFDDRPRQRAVQRLEADVLGYQGQRSPQLRADPFRAVRIADAYLPANATSVDPVDLVSLRRGRSGDASGIQMFYEMAFSALDNEQIAAAGSLTLDAALARTPTQRGRRWDFDRCVAREVTAESILSACKALYCPRLEDEAGRVAEVRPDVRGTYDRLLSWADGLGENEALLRLGQFSHVECMTLAPPLRRATGGNSRGLAAGMYPMGWAKLTLSERGA